MLEQDRFGEELGQLLTPLLFRTGGGEARQGPEVDTAAWFNTPGVTVAAATSSAHGGYKACHAEWGSRRLPEGPSPDADTLFQACSISKAFQSLAILRYISEGVIAGLDSPVKPYLSGETYQGLLDNSVRRGVPEELAARLLDRMTIVELLSHTAGSTTHGFQGYPTSTSRFPSTTEILQGGLERGEYHVHPEQGAAGLWTTSRDLVRGMTAFAHSLLGTGAAVEMDGGEPWVRPEVARQMLLRRSELGHGARGYYCGFHVEFLGGEGDFARDEKLVRISHAGSNYGYRCWAAAAFPFPIPFPGSEEEPDRDGREATAAAAVTVKAQAIMTNSNYGNEAVGPLMLAVGAMLDSPLGPARGVGMAFEEATPAVALDPRPAATTAPGPAGMGWAAWVGEWEVQDRTQTLRIMVGAAEGEEEEEEVVMEMKNAQLLVVFSHLGEGITLPLLAVAERKGPERTRLRVGPLEVTLAFGWRQGTGKREGGEASLALCTGGTEIECLRRPC